MFEDCSKCGSDTHNSWAHEEIEHRVRHHIANNLRTLSQGDDLEKMILLHSLADGIENYEY